MERFEQGSLRLLHKKYIEWENPRYGKQKAGKP